MPDKEMNDAALLIGIAGGDRAALTSLYDRYGSTLFALARHIVGRSDIASELLQDVFLDLWSRPPGYEPQLGTVRAWLILRTRRYALRARPNAPVAGGDQAQRAAAQQQSPLDRERRAVRRALQGLSGDQRDVLDLAYFSGLSQGEMARKLAVPVHTIKLRFAAARARLKVCLQDLRRA